MQDQSVLFANANELTSNTWNFPDTAGTVLILRYIQHRGAIFFFSKGGTVGDYRMFISQDGSPTGNWIKRS